MRSLLTTGVAGLALTLSQLANAMPAHTIEQIEANERALQILELERASDDIVELDTTRIIVHTTFGENRQSISINHETNERYVTTWTYDEQNRVLRQEGNTFWRQYSYNDLANTMTETSSSGAYVYRSFDQRGRQLTWFSSFPGRAAINSTTRYIDSHGIQIETRSDGASIHRHFDGRGNETYYLYEQPNRDNTPTYKGYREDDQLLFVERGENRTDYVYTSFGKVDRIVRNGETQTQNFYDDQQRLILSATETSQSHYEYEEANNITRQVSSYDGGEVHILRQHDDQDRVVFESYKILVDDGDDYFSITHHIYE